MDTKRNIDFEFIFEDMIANYVDLFDRDAIIMELEQSYDIFDEDLQE